MAVVNRSSSRRRRRRRRRPGRCGLGRGVSDSGSRVGGGGGGGRDQGNRRRSDGCRTG